MNIILLVIAITFLTGAILYTYLKKLKRCENYEVNKELQDSWTRLNSYIILYNFLDFIPFLVWTLLFSYLFNFTDIGGVDSITISTIISLPFILIFDISRHFQINYYKALTACPLCGNDNLEWRDKTE